MKRCNVANLLSVFALALVCFVCLAPAPLAGAQEGGQSDQGATGSISVTLRSADDHQVVSGGTLALYQVGKVVQNNADLSFALTDGFAGSKVSLANLEDEDLAAELASYAKSNKVARAASASGASGTAQFSGLSQGVYLVVQTKAAKGYNAALPFLVTLPGKDAAGGQTMTVDASPKVDVVSATPTPPSETPNPPSPETPPSQLPPLPQTGTLNWPVPVLAICGSIFLAVGSVLLLSRKNRRPARA